jgi:hypothetical protein
VIEVVICPDCRSFLGLITSDGRGPLFERCPDARLDCPMRDKLDEFQSEAHRRCAWPLPARQRASWTDRPEKDRVTLMKSLGNEVDTVMVGDDTRRRQPVATTVRDIREHLDAVMNRKNQLQGRLAELNARARGHKLPDGQYRTLVDEQTELKKEQVQLEKRHRELKTLMQEQCEEENRLKHDRWSGEISEILQRVKRIESALNQLLSKEGYRAK